MSKKRIKEGATKDKNVITERRRAEEALRESEEKYRSLVESSSDSIYMLGKDLRYLSANNELLSRLGLSRDEVIGKSFSELHSPEETEELAERVKKVFETGKVAQQEHRSDRLGRWFLRTLSPCKDIRSGKVSAVTVVSKDITERKQAEEKLRESEKRYRTLVETMNEGLEVLDENNLFIYANDRFCEMLGYSRDEIIGRPITDFVDKSNQDILKEQGARRRKGERGSYELVWTRKDGQKIFTIISAVPILDADGHYKGSFAVNTDITDRKRAEGIIRSFHDVGVAIQKTMDEETIFNIVGRGLDKLDLRPAIYMLDEEKKNAKIKRNILPPVALALAERLVGLKLDEFSIPVDKVPAFRDVVREQKTVILHNPAETIGQFLVSGEPSRRKQAAKLADLFGTKSAICSPLIVRGEVVGIFTVCSKNLVEGEATTIVNAFAYQMGTAIENARLYEEVKQELAKRKKAEEEVGKMSGN